MVDTKKVNKLLENLLNLKERFDPIRAAGDFRYLKRIWNKRFNHVPLLDIMQKHKIGEMHKYKLMIDVLSWDKLAHDLEKFSNAREYANYIYQTGYPDFYYKLSRWVSAIKDALKIGWDNNINESRRFILDYLDYFINNVTYV